MTKTPLALVFEIHERILLEQGVTCATQVSLIRMRCDSNSRQLFQKKRGGGWEKSNTLLLLVNHFEITISSCVARLSTTVLTNFKQSCYSTLTIYVDWPLLVSLLNSQRLRSPIISSYIA